VRRRDALALLGGAAILWSLAGYAQQPIARIGFLGIPPESDASFAPYWEAFLAVLQQKGWRENRNIVFDRRWSEGRPETYPSLAAELIANRPDLIIALSSQAIQVARQQTDKIPIVAVGSADLVALGLIASLARPGGNVTGFSVEQGAIGGQWLQMLQETHPGMSRVGLFFTPANPASKLEAEKTAALAPQLGIVVEPIAVNAPEDIDAAFAAIVRSRPDGLVVHPTPALWSHDREIAAFALDQRLPTITGFTPMVRDGLLMSYAPDHVDMWRHAATLVDKILKGATPADIPVELPTKFELVINLKTAKALGLTVPQSILARADEVIE
jgi:putative tryptophan/tyrosine transport system substrate-binding protein